MAVEQTLKALLLHEGLIFRRVHDISGELIRLKNKNTLPTKVRLNFDEILKIFITLTDQRSFAGYGFENELDVDFFSDMAPWAYKKAEWVLELFQFLNN